MSLGQVLAWLDSHVNMETGVGFAPAARTFEPPTLARLRRLLASLGDPQLDLDVMHITGTNGKGSTARLASALISASGGSVSTYTSPHLELINERIVANGLAIANNELAEVLEVVRRAETAAQESCSWFELVTGAAFRWSSDLAVSAAVVEVGVGGRWDATNTADGRVAVITNIDLDHQEWLGGTRESIAEEKVGIVKPGAVVVIGETDLELTDTLERRALELGADRVLRRGRDFECTSNRLALGGRVIGVRTPASTFAEVLVPFHGAHQATRRLKQRPAILSVAISASPSLT